jgi:hypothetical protein
MQICKGHIHVFDPIDILSVLFARERPQFSCGIARVNAGFGNRARHDTTRPNHDIVADFDGQYGRVRSYRDPVSNGRCLPQVLVASGRSTGCKNVVHEHYAVANEAVFADRNQLADKRMRLDPGATPDPDRSLDFDERADENTIPDLATIKVDWLYNGDTLAEYDIADADREALACRPGVAGVLHAFAPIADQVASVSGRNEA